VVGILVDEVLCFETNKRVPYKIVFECIELGNQSEGAEKEDA